ncbi:MAG: FG-GAP-like repeat-containing protein, partial [Candidatus Pacearchaeota archaeon]
MKVSGYSLSAILKYTFQKFIINSYMKFLRILVWIMFFSFNVHAQVENLSGVDSTIYISHTIFLPKYSTPSGQEPWSVAAADFDGNGTIDLASCSQVDSKINIHFNDGKGNLSPAKSFPTGNSPRAIWAADFNNDGKPDLATVSIKDGKLNWHLNQGNGNFQNIKSLNTGSFPHWVTAGDFNHDRNIDLITIANNENKVYLFAGDGNGNFTYLKSFFTGDKPRKVVLYDMNRDGKNDILTSCDDGLVYIHYGNGTDFIKGTTLNCGGHAVWGFEVADINKDGLPDVVAATYLGNNIYWFHNNGDKTFKSFEPVLSGAMNFDIVLDDFDLDGDIDAITASSRDQNVNVHLNDGKGHFGPRNSFRSGNWNSRILGYDMDGDGDKDIITASFKDNNLNIHRNISIDPEHKKVKECSIEGNVYDTKSKNPLSAVVSLVDDQGKTINATKTDNNGKYYLKIPCDKKYKLVVKAPNYPEFNEYINFPKDETHLKKDIYLDRDTEGFIFGKIRDAKTLKPLNAVITIKDIYGKIVFQDQLTEYKKYLPFSRGYKIE